VHQPLKNGRDDNIPDYGNVIVTVKELASVLGLSEPQIYTLRRRNIIQPIRAIRAHKTEFRLGPAVRAYIQFKCGQDSEAQADFHKERALKEAANRELREILLKQTREQLHRSQDVRAIQEDSNSDIRSKLLMFGNLLSSQIAGKSDPAEVKTVIDAEVRKTLNELREYSPRDYYRRQKSIARLS
jgi:hypothetical protein